MQNEHDTLFLLMSDCVQKPKHNHNIKQLNATSSYPTHFLHRRFGPFWIEYVIAKQGKHRYECSHLNRNRRYISSASAIITRLMDRQSLMFLTLHVGVILRSCSLVRRSSSRIWEYLREKSKIAKARLVLNSK